MKKLVLFAFIAIAVMTACNGNKTANVSSNDTDTVVVDSLDSTAVDSTVCLD